MRNHLNKNGFTLIELSIVLVIIGMLVGLGGKMIGPLMTFAKVRETRDIMDSDVQSIVSWAASNNMIPHAKNITDQKRFSYVVKSPLDAWGRNFVYLYDANLEATNIVCASNSTKLTLVTSDPAVTIANVAFMVLSGADNSTLKSTITGTLSAVTATNATITASSAATGTVTASGPNADLIRWVTLDELKSKIGCIGGQLQWGVGSALKIVNNELPYGNYSSPYSATIFADGGVDSGSYQWRIVKNTFPDDTFPNGITATASPFINSTSALKFTNMSTNWSTPSTSLNIQGHPRPTGSYYFSVFVKDALGNTSKPFVLTVNPAK